MSKRDVGTHWECHGEVGLRSGEREGKSGEWGGTNGKGGVGGSSGKGGGQI